MVVVVVVVVVAAVVVVVDLSATYEDDVYDKTSGGFHIADSSICSCKCLK